jgi:hypothetical protein
VRTSALAVVALDGLTSGRLLVMFASAVAGRESINLTSQLIRGKVLI